MTVAIFASHFGLGDAIMFFGCVRYLADRYARVAVMCKERNLPRVKAIYRDMPTVDVVSFGESENLLIGAINRVAARANGDAVVYFNGKWAHGGRMPDDFLFPDSLYQDMRIPTSFRKSLFLPAAAGPSCPIAPNRPYIFVADRSTTTKIPLYEALAAMHPNTPVVSADRNDVYSPNHPFYKICERVVRRGDTEICDYTDIISNALEIHCIDSALWCLADTLDPPTPRRKTVFIRWDIVQSSPSFERFVCDERSTLTREGIQTLLSRRRFGAPQNMSTS